MFQIGEFSRIARVTIETLRHYDTIGLLKPAKIDPFTGYRYYNAAQLQSLNQILALKEVGLSLEEISRILKDKLTVDELRGILKAQLVVTESRIEEAQHRRELILARLESLSQEETLPEYEVSMKSTEGLMIAAIRETIARAEQIPQHWNASFTAIASWMKGQKLPIGIPMALYHDEGYSIENIDTECAFTIPNIELGRIPKPNEPIVIRQIEPIPSVASIVVANFPMKVGGLQAAYAVLGRWVATNGYHIIAAPRELYFGSPETDDFTAEIQFPISKLNHE